MSQAKLTCIFIASKRCNLQHIRYFACLETNLSSLNQKTSKRGGMRQKGQNEWYSPVPRSIDLSLHKYDQDTTIFHVLCAAALFHMQKKWKSNMHPLVSFKTLLSCFTVAGITVGVSCGQNSREGRKNKFVKIVQFQTIRHQHYWCIWVKQLRQEPSPTHFWKDWTF